MTKHSPPEPRRDAADPPGLSGNQRTALTALAADAAEYVNRIPQDTADLDVYIVGGAVRDALLSEPANDYDFLVVGETVESMLDRGFNDINASSFGVLHDANHEEWALARTETKTGDGYKGIDVDTEDVTLREDLKRRDLRINAMAVRLGNGAPAAFDETECVELSDDTEDAALIDPFNGRSDLNHGRIRHVSEAFSEDPIRVLRAARYVARFESEPDAPEYLRDELPDAVPFVIEGDTKQLMRNVAPELNRMSRDRIGEEIVKAMDQAVDPTRFWDALRAVGALAVIAPKLDRATIVPAGPEKFHREGDTYRHTMMVLEQMHELCEARDITGIDRVRRYMMVLAHDLGKVTLADEQGGLWSDDPPRRFGGHAQTGVADAAALADRLGLDGHISEAMQDAAELHMDIHDLPVWESDRLIEFVDQHDPAPEAETPYMATVEELLDLAAADHQGRFQNQDVAEIDTVLEDDADAPDGAGRPVFNRAPFTARVDAARTAIEDISGFEVLRTGLCDDHAVKELPDGSLSTQLGQCEACRTPGPWVGEQLNERRHEHIENNA